MRFLNIFVTALIMAAVALPLPARAQSYPPGSTEVLILTTSTLVPAAARKNRRAIELQNNGPNPIYCVTGKPSDGALTAVVGKSRKIAANGGEWAFSATYDFTVYCITSANQATGAALAVTEL